MPLLDKRWRFIAMSAHEGAGNRRPGSVRDSFQASGQGTRVDLAELLKAYCAFVAETMRKQE